MDEQQTPDTSLEPASKPAVAEQLQGQHIYIAVRGASSQAAFDVAKERGLRVLDIRRIRDEVAPETDEIEVDDPKEKGKKVKMQVVRPKQTPVYHALDTDSDDDDKRSSSHKELPKIVDAENTYVLKASAPRTSNKL